MLAGLKLQNDPITTFQVLQICILVVGATLTVLQLGRTARSARATNLLTITKNHREIWTFALDHPDTFELMDPEIPFSGIENLSNDQRQFVNFLLLHMASAHALVKGRLLSRNRSARRDVGGVLALPAFRAIWAELQSYHPARFRRYANKCLKYVDEQKLLPRSAFLEASQKLEELPVGNSVKVSAGVSTHKKGWWSKRP